LRHSFVDGFFVLGNIVIFLFAFIGFISEKFILQKEEVAQFISEKNLFYFLFYG